MVKIIKTSYLRLSSVIISAVFEVACFLSCLVMGCKGFIDSAAAASHLMIIDIIRPS